MVDTNNDDSTILYSHTYQFAEAEIFIDKYEIKKNHQNM